MDEILWWLYIAVGGTFGLSLLMVLWVSFLMIEVERFIYELETLIFTTLDDGLQILIPTTILNYISQHDVANFEINTEVTKESAETLYAEDVVHPLSEKLQMYEEFGDSERQTDGQEFSVERTSGKTLERVRSLHSVEVVFGQKKSKRSGKSAESIPNKDQTPGKSPQPRSNVKTPNKKKKFGLKDPSKERTPKAEKSKAFKPSMSKPKSERLTTQQSSRVVGRSKNEESKAAIEKLKNIEKLRIVEKSERKSNSKKSEKEKKSISKTLEAKTELSLKSAKDKSISKKSDGSNNSDSSNRSKKDSKMTEKKNSVATPKKEN